MNLNQWLEAADDRRRSWRWSRRFNDWANNLERALHGQRGRWVDGRLVYRDEDDA